MPFGQDEHLRRDLPVAGSVKRLCEDIMIGLVLVTHGGLAMEFRMALEHVVGAQESIETVAIQDAVREGTFADIAKAVEYLPPDRSYDYGVNRDRHEEIRDARIVFYGATARGAA